MEKKRNNLQFDSEFKRTLNIYNSLDFYDAETGKRHSFKKAKVNEYPSEKGDKRWVITAEEGRVFMVTKSY